MSVVKPLIITLFSLAIWFSIIGCNQEPDVATKPQSGQTAQAESASEASEPPITETKTKTAIQQMIDPDNDLFKDMKALSAVQSSLESLPNLKGKDIQVFQSPHFYSNGRIIIQIQDPDKPEKVDEYVYRDGGWKAPRPVETENITDSAFTPLSDISFSKISVINKAWKEKAQSVNGAEDSELGHVYLNINLVTGKRRWFCDSVTGLDASYFIAFNLDGSLDSYKEI